MKVLSEGGIRDTLVCYQGLYQPLEFCGPTAKSLNLNDPTASEGCSRPANNDYKKRESSINTVNPAVCF